ncbi:uncharacterized protein LOC135946124 [Cloeon dipterum]|uniref:uncharacterized protein LOC135946124 n=1 Tax=Cloeon dipterum TaxID=197152 RepID=UPI00321FE17B
MHSGMGLGQPFVANFAPAFYGMQAPQAFQFNPQYPAPTRQPFVAHCYIAPQAWPPGGVPPCSPFLTPSFNQDGMTHNQPTHCQGNNLMLQQCQESVGFAFPSIPVLARLPLQHQGKVTLPQRSLNEAPASVIASSENPAKSNRPKVNVPPLQMPKYEGCTFFCPEPDCITTHVSDSGLVKHFKENHGEYEKCVIPDCNYHFVDNFGRIDHMIEKHSGNLPGGIQYVAIF